MKVKNRDKKRNILLKSKLVYISLLAFLLCIGLSFALNITSPTNGSSIVYATNYSWAKNTSIAPSTYYYNFYLNNTLVNTYYNYYIFSDLNNYSTSSASYVLVHTYNVSTKLIKSQLNIGIYRVGGPGFGTASMYLLIHYSNGSNLTTDVQTYDEAESFGSCKSVAFTQNISTSSNVSSIDVYVKIPSGFTSGICGTYLSWYLENTSTSYVTSFNPYPYNLSIGSYILNISAFNYSSSLLDSATLSENLNYDSLLNISSSVSANISLNDGRSCVSNNCLFDVVRGSSYTVTTDNSSYSLNITSISISNVSLTDLNINLLPNNALNITIYDEVTGLIISSNTSITLSAVNPSFSHTYIANGTIVIANLSSNNYSILVSNPSYSVKNYYVSIPNRSFQNLNFYLNNGSATLFNFKTSSGAVLPNVLFQVYSYVNNSLTLTESAISDITGKVQISARANTYYYFTTFLYGYSNYSFSLNPVLFNSYDVILSPSGGIVVIPSASVSYSPNVFSMALNNSFAIRFNSPYGSLSHYSYNVSFSGGSIGGSGNNSYGSRFTDSFVVPKTVSDSNVVVYYEYNLSNGVYQNFTFTYRVPVTYVNHTLVSFGHDNYGLLTGDKIGVFVLIALPLVGLAFLFSSSITFAMFVLMFLSGIFGANGFINTGTSVGIIILCVIFIIGKGSQ